MHADRERGYNHQFHNHHRDLDHPPPHPSVRERQGYADAEPLYREERDRFFPMPRHAYPKPGGVSRDTRDAYPPHAGSRGYPEESPAGGGAGGFLEPKRECPNDMDRGYDLERESPYPEYRAMRRGRAEPAVDMSVGGGDKRGFSALAPQQQQTRSGARGAPQGAAAVGSTVASAAGIPTQHPMYKAAKQVAGSSSSLSYADGGGGIPRQHNTRGSHPSAGAGGGSPTAHGRRESEPGSPPSLRGNSASAGAGAVSRGVAVAPQTKAAAAATRDAPPMSAGAAAPTRPTRDRARGNGDGDPAPRIRSRSPPDSPHDASQAVGVSREAPPSSDGGGADNKPFCEVVRDEHGVVRLFIPETPPIVPRRPPSKGNKRETLGDIAHRIPVSVMRPYFNYPLRTAAEVRDDRVAVRRQFFVVSSFFFFFCSVFVVIFPV